MSKAVNGLFFSTLYLYHLPSKLVHHLHLTHFVSSRRNEEPSLLSLNQIPISSNFKTEMLTPNVGMAFYYKYNIKKEQATLCRLLAHLSCMNHKKYILASTEKVFRQCFIIIKKIVCNKTRDTVAFI